LGKVAVAGGLLLPEPVFTLEDLRLLFVQKKKAVLRAAWIGAAFGFLSIFAFAPVYKIEASFKEKPEQSGTETSIRDLFLNGLKATQQPEAVSLMKSLQVLKAVVSSHGLQAEVKRGFFQPFRRFRDHLYAQMRWKAPEPDWFLFEQIDYEGEETLKFGLRFTDPETFQVWKGRKMIAVGKVGKPVHCKEVSFTLSKIPKILLFRKSYRLTVSPWILKTQELRKKLKIVPQKTSKSIYDLTLLFKDRKRGAKVLNSIMEEYRAFLKFDHDQIMAEQIAYLEQKQSQIYEEMIKIFNEHAAVLSDAVRKQEFFDLKQEIKSYSETHARILNIDLELKKLQGSFGEKEEFARKIWELGEERSLLQIGNQNLICSNKLLKDPTNNQFDLEASRALYADYAKKFDESLEKIESLSQMKELELNALAALLKDPLSQEVIANAASLTLKLQDQKYSSPKERLRWSEDLELQKKILHGHVEQLLKVETMNASIFREKMGELQRSSLSNIDQQISILKEQSKGEVEKRANALLEERKMLQQKIEESKNLPERWKLENWLLLKTDLGKEVMKILTELVESKTIGHQLFHIESKPLDAAIAPKLLENSYLIFLTAVSAFGFSLAYFAVAILSAAIKGLPLTPSALKAMGLPFSGELFKRETFRRLSFFLDGKVASLFGGDGPDYSHFFSEHLATFQKKVLLIDCSFGVKEDLSVYPRSNYFFAASGENFSSKRFSEFLEASRNFYDAILLWHSGNFNSADASMLLRISEKAIITITKEQREELTPLLHWAYHDGNYRVTFISSPHEG
jgi:hypothetical protein